MLVTRRNALTLAAGGAVAVALPKLPRIAHATPSPPPEDFGFGILFDGDEVGTHQVSVTPGPNEILVNTEIEIVVKVAFITVFEYAHSAEEHWQNGRLVSLRSSTLRNGDKLKVDGEATPNGFRVIGNQGPFTVPADFWTSNTLWDPGVLGHEAVIDAQHGGEIGVNSKPLGNGSVEVGGQRIAATRHRIITPHIAGVLWYDESDRWVKASFDCRGETIVYDRKA